MNKHNWRKIRTLRRSKSLGFELTRTPEGPESYKETMEHGLVGDVHGLLMCTQECGWNMLEGWYPLNQKSMISEFWEAPLSFLALLRRPFLNFLSRFAAFACGSYNGLHRCPAIDGSSSHRSLPFGNPK